MRTREGRILVVLAAVVAAMGLFIFLREDGGDGGGESEPAQTETVQGGQTTTAPTEPKVPLIVVRNGEPVGGAADLEFSRGERIRFRVRSDVSEQIHFHGYDVSKEITPGQVVEIDIPADIEGVFEVELENSAVPIAKVTVSPG